MQACLDGIEESRFAAEQMGHAGDVENQAVGRIERHQRRESLQPVEAGAERGGFRLWIGRHRQQAGTDGARIGQAHAGPD